MPANNAIDSKNQPDTRTGGLVVLVLLLLCAIAAWLCVFVSMMQPAELQQTLVHHETVGVINVTLQPCNTSINDQITSLEMVELGGHFYYFSVIKLVLVNNEAEKNSLQTHLLNMPLSRGSRWLGFWTHSPNLKDDEDVDAALARGTSCYELQRVDFSVTWRRSSCRWRRRFVCRMNQRCRYQPY
ncbi:hypothetical protein B566_EDAN014633 [Ephemera danica]|nr:hypothetical protein B566_EDAN014633 [Ephemera danica]